MHCKRNLEIEQNQYNTQSEILPICVASELFFIRKRMLKICIQLIQRKYSVNYYVTQNYLKDYTTEKNFFFLYFCEI